MPKTKLEDFPELTAEQILSMDDDEFMEMWEAWESRDTLALQENLNQKGEWLWSN